MQQQQLQQQQAQAQQQQPQTQQQQQQLPKGTAKGTAHPEDFFDPNGAIAQLCEKQAAEKAEEQRLQKELQDLKAQKDQQVDAEKQKWKREGVRAGAGTSAEHAAMPAHPPMYMTSNTMEIDNISARVPETDLQCTN